MFLQNSHCQAKTIWVPFGIIKPTWKLRNVGTVTIDIRPSDEVQPESREKHLVKRDTFPYTAS